MEPTKEEPRLSDAFLADYHKWACQMDVLAERKFEGLEMEQLAEQFLARWTSYMDRFEFATATSSPASRQVSMRPSAAQTRADLDILTSQHHLEKAPHYARVLSRVWRRTVAASYFRQSKELNNTGKAGDDRLLLLRARKSIRYDPESCLSIMWFAVAASFHLLGLKGGHEKLECAQLVRVASNRCVELDGLAAWLAIHMVGRVDYSMCSLTWMEKMATKAFGYDHLLVSYREAEDHFRTSHLMHPGWLPNALWLAKICLATKRASEARDWLELGLQMQVDEPALEPNLVELLELQKRNSRQLLRN